MPRLQETLIRNRAMVQPNHANSLQTAHGGNVMKWMDEVGAMAAMRFAGQNCVTARMDQVNFEAPIPVGETALVEAYVYAAGRTSVRVRVQVYREDPLTGDTAPTTSSYAVYVAIDDDHRPTPVPALRVESEEEVELRDAALDDEQRREDD